MMRLPDHCLSACAGLCSAACVHVQACARLHASMCRCVLQQRRGILTGLASPVNSSRTTTQTPSAGVCSTSSSPGCRHTWQRTRWLSPRRSASRALHHCQRQPRRSCAASSSARSASTRRSGPRLLIASWRPVLRAHHNPRCSPRVLLLPCLRCNLHWL